MSNKEDVDLGDVAEEEFVPLDEKYAQQMRQIFPQKIELPISTLQSMVDAQIELNPDFQRRDVWDPAQQSRFIESLIMNVPIPPVFMGESDYGKYVVLDGRQRLTAIVRFLKNEYPLEGLHVWPELNGKRYSELKELELDVTITRRFLPAVVLLKESSPEVKYDVFERLNTGGMKLNAMEIRNAVYRGPFTDLLHDFAGRLNFRKLWAIPENDNARKKNKTYRRMTDLELVLRFFALTHAQDNAGEKRPVLKQYLSIFMRQQNERLAKGKELADEYSELFDRASNNCLWLLGEDAFQREGRTTRSAPLADALMYAVSNLSLSESEAKKLKPAVKRAVRELESSNDDFLDALSTGTNGKAKIETRLGEARKAIESATESDK